MSADAERFCERQNRQPIQIGFVSDMSADAERFVSFQKSADPNRFSELSADAERFCERQNKQPIQIGFVSGVCRLMLRGFVSAKTIS